jgi:hypothetical protein
MLFLLIILNEVKDLAEMLRCAQHDNTREGYIHSEEEDELLEERTVLFDRVE